MEESSITCKQNVFVRGRLHGEFQPGLEFGLKFGCSIENWPRWKEISLVEANFCHPGGMQGRGSKEGRVAPRAQQVAAALPVCCWAIVVSTASLNVNFANNSFRLICSERRPQIKRWRRLSFICSWIHLFPQGSTGQPTKSIWIEKRDWSWILAVQKQLTNSVFTRKIL